MFLRNNETVTLTKGVNIQRSNDVTCVMSNTTAYNKHVYKSSLSKTSAPSVPSGNRKDGDRLVSGRRRFDSPRWLSLAFSKVAVCGHCPVSEFAPRS